MCEILSKYITLNYLFIFVLLCYICSHWYFSIKFNSFSIIIFLQLYKDEVFMTMFYDLLLWWNSYLINCTILMTNNVNTISGDRNLIKDSKRAYTMSLVVFDSMWMTLYMMIDLEKSFKTNLVPRDKRSYGCTLQN